MRNALKAGLTVATVAALGVGLVIGRGCAAESPYTGTWKLTAIEGPGEVNLVIIKIGEKDGKPIGSVVAGISTFNDAKIEDAKVDDKSLHFTLKGRRSFAVAVYPPKMGAKSDKVYGSLNLGKQYVPLILEKTDATEIDQKKASGPTEGADEWQKAVGTKDDKERETALKAVLEKYGDKPIALIAAPILLQASTKTGASTEELSGTATRYLKAAAVYGPDIENQAVLQAAQMLVRSEKGAPAAVAIASNAWKQLGDSAPSAQAVPVLKVLAAGLKKTGKTNEAKPIEERLAKLEDQLDQEFIKNAIPFKPRTFAGRSGKSERVAVVELFTGAQCPPCVSADIAFDAAAKVYKPTDVVLLEYHLHIPQPDALTNADSVARAEYYGDKIGGTPTMFLDGSATESMGGYTEHGEEKYNLLRKLINDRLEVDQEARLTVKAERKGDKISLQAEAADLKKRGAKVRLRFVLIEDVVRYAGSNGQRVHHHVVRAFPGGIEGVEMKDKTGKASAEVDLADLAKKLNTYLSDYRGRGGNESPFAEDDRPLGLKHLKVVALIQDDESKEILQAAQVEVPEAK